MPLGVVRGVLPFSTSSRYVMLQIRRGDCWPSGRAGFVSSADNETRLQCTGNSRADVAIGDGPSSEVRAGDGVSPLRWLMTQSVGEWSQEVQVRRTNSASEDSVGLVDARCKSCVNLMRSRQIQCSICKVGITSSSQTGEKPATEQR